MRILILLLMVFGLTACAGEPIPDAMKIKPGDVLPTKPGATYLLLPVIGDSTSVFEFCGRPNTEFKVTGLATNPAFIWCDTPAFTIQFGKRGRSWDERWKKQEPMFTLEAENTGRFEYHVFEVPPGPQYLAKSFSTGGNTRRHSVHAGHTLALDLLPGKINYASHMLLAGGSLKPTAVDIDKARAAVLSVGGPAAAALMEAVPLMKITAECKKPIDVRIMLTGTRQVQCDYGIAEPINSEAPELESDQIISE